VARSISLVTLVALVAAMTMTSASGCSERSDAHVFAKRPEPRVEGSASFPPPAPPIAIAGDAPVSPVTPELVFAVGPIASSMNVSWALVAPRGTDLDAPRRSYSLTVARSTDGGRSFLRLWPADTRNDVIAMYVHDDQSVTVAVDAPPAVKIERTTDGGQVWLSFPVTSDAGVLGGFFDEGCRHLTLETTDRAEEVFLLGKHRDRAWRVSRRGEVPPALLRGG
jgi:hypothetical protein